jgi:hypothetical protein
MKVVSTFLLAFFLVAGTAMLWQHWRYLRARRNLVQDRQATFQPPGAFHVLTFLSTAPRADVIEELRALKRATEGSEATWIYAGKTALNALASAQIGDKSWSAVVLLQYPSRAAYDRHSGSEPMRTALGRFEEVYRHGFERHGLVSALIPQALLALRTGQLLRGRPSHFPFVRSAAVEEFPQADEYARQILGERELGANAVVIVNLLKHGSAEQRAANRGYSLSMLGAMAEGGYGPMHIGRAIRIEGDEEFDDVAIVYYPGVEFFADMMRSEYFQGISGDKQLGDTQAVVTVPILDRI